MTVEDQMIYESMFATRNHQPPSCAPTSNSWQSANSHIMRSLLHHSPSLAPSAQPPPHPPMPAPPAISAFSANSRPYLFPPTPTSHSITVFKHGTYDLGNYNGTRDCTCKTLRNKCRINIKRMNELQNTLLKLHACQSLY